MNKALARLLPYITRVRRPLALGLACILFATAISLVSPWLLKFVVDGLLRGEDRSRLALYALAIVGLAVADGVFRYLMRTQLIGASRQIEYELRTEFFAHLERLPQAYLQANRTGDLMSRTTNDLSAVRMMVGPALMYFASTALGFVVAVAIMCSIDAKLTLIALLPLFPALGALAVRSGRRALAVLLLLVPVGYFSWFGWNVAHQAPISAFPGQTLPKQAGT